MNKIIYICMMMVTYWVTGTAQYYNPFEIKHRLDSIYMQSGTEPEPGFIEESVPDEPDTSIVLPEELNLKNPFDVDHVPLRKSELQRSSVMAPSSIKDESVPPVRKGTGLMVFIFSLLSLLLIAVIASVKRSLFSKIFRSFTNDNLLKLTQREENNGLNGGFVLLYIVYAINVSTFIYLMLQQNAVTFLSNWLLILLAILTIYLVRHIAMYFLGVIFPVSRESSQYSFLIAVVNILMGLILLPFNLLIAYGPDYISVSAVYIILGIIAFLFIVRMIKGILLGLINYGSNLFHFFLYLCTFEIAPALLIFRFFSNMGA